MRIVFAFLFALYSFCAFSQEVCRAELLDQDLSNQAELDSLAAQLNGVQFRLEAEVSYFKVRHVIF